MLPAALPSALPVIEGLQNFVTIFLGIFFEAAPYLLLGALFSGAIQVFVSQELVERIIPRQPVLGALAGACLGLAFPVCDCGVVPITRRLYQKGLPLPAGIAFVLAGPAVNPIVIASTFTAFGWGPVLWGRFVFIFLIAVACGLLFHLARPDETLIPETRGTEGHVHPSMAKETRGGQRLIGALATARDDFADTVRFLIAGALLAAGMQTVVPQSTLLSIGQGPVTSVLAMLGLAFVLSVCSTVDAFLALSFVNTFTGGSILAFLIFGPMVDIKNAMMFLRVFRRRTVLYLILLPLLLTTLITVYLNLNVKGLG